MPKKKKTTTSGELVMVKSVHRTRSRRIKFCVHGGLWDSLNKQRLKPNGYPGALLATFAGVTYHLWLPFYLTYMSTYGILK